MLADEVLPEWITSRAVMARGMPSWSARGSMMRRFASCGMKAARSSGRIPASSQVRRASSAACVIAQR